MHEPARDGARVEFARDSLGSDEKSSIAAGFPARLCRHFLDNDGSLVPRREVRLLMDESPARFLLTARLQVLSQSSCDSSARS